MEVSTIVAQQYGPEVNSTIRLEVFFHMEFACNLCVYVELQQNVEEKHQDNLQMYCL